MTELVAPNAVKLATRSYCLQLGQLSLVVRITTVSLFYPGAA